MIDAIRSIYSVPVIDISVKSSGRSRYSELEVKQAMALYNKVNCYGEVEKQLGISRNTVRLWASKYLQKNILQDVNLYNINKKRPTKGANEVKPAERHDMLVTLLKGIKMTPIDIAEKLKVSVVTIRRDILDLMVEGKIIDVSQIKKLRLVTAA